MAVVAVYVVVVGFGLLSAEDSKPMASQDLFNLVAGGGLWLAVCLGWVPASLESALDCDADD